MKRAIIYKTIETSLRTDKKNNPSFPDHAAGMAGRVMVPAGDLMQHAMFYKYGAENMTEVELNLMKNSAIQTAVQAIRFLEHLK